ncbi:MAG TPA: hypothetical protein VN680_19265 [Burkholderiaceae bacterium]|nr:hypothetical protein [Burkholderiaceae bacterium]
MTKTTKTAAKAANLNKGTSTTTSTPTATTGAQISPAAAARSLPAPSKPVKAEPLGPLQPVTMPSRMLAAALLAASKGDVRFYLNGVQLTRAGDQLLRIASTNGHALFVSHVKTDQVLPEWVDDVGVIVDRERLPTLLKLAGTAEGDEVELSFGKNHPQLVADVGGWATLKLGKHDGRFPDLNAVISGGAEALTHEGAVPLEAAGLDPAYVKLAAQISTQLGAKVVRAFTGNSAGVSVFTFADAAAALYIMPMRDASQVSASTAAILAPAIRRSMAALKAHETRLLEAAKSAKPEAAEDLKAKAAAFAQRIKALATAAGDRALPAPTKAKGKPGPKPKAKPAAKVEAKLDESPAETKPAVVH